MSEHMIEAPLCPDCKADIVFHLWVDQDNNHIILIDTVLPFGIVPPTADLLDLAYDWLHTGGGYDACCRIAEVKS